MNERIFISYARADGNDEANRLIKLLSTEGHPTWHDLRKLEPDRSVWSQIEGALKASEFLIVIVTPAALKSDYIRAEWREARRQGLTVMPVMAMKQSRSTLPRWLRRCEIYDLEEPVHREKFLSRLNSSGRIFRADWDAGLEIETFIARPKLFAQIKALLLSETAEPVSLTSALQGRGGYGKSVLAGEIARDPEIRDAYIDGVFWVDLGQDNPDVLGKINDLIRRISGANGAPDVNTGAEELRRLLEKRDVLIILDDVWRKQDLYPFAKATGQGNATLLATTRKLDALPPSAQTIDISGMEPDEAVALLSYGLVPDDTEQRALSKFASDFWHWPQLLAIANGLLRGRLSDSDALLHALETIAEGARRGVVPGKDERERTITNVMQMGIDDLEATDRERFKTLVVLPEDTAIPVAILAPLWGLSQYEAEEFARLLLDRRLIQSRDLSDQGVGARIRMHDDMLWYLGAITDEASKRVLHSALLGPHRPANGNWAELEKQNPALHYLWRHLLWHLGQEGEEKTANVLRIDYAWIKAKLILLGIDGLLKDYRPRPDDRDAALVGNALDLSRHELEFDSGHLGFQLFGRLNRFLSNDLNILCEAARHDIPLFDPTLLHLNPSDEEVLRIVADSFQVNSVAFSPDGRRIVSGGGDGDLYLWSADSGALLANPLRGHHGGYRSGIFSVAFSPDGRRIVSVGRDRTVRLWDAATGVAWGEPLCGHQAGVFCVAFSPDSRRIVSGSCDGKLQLWCADTGMPLGNPQRGDGHSVNSVAFSPDGGRIVSAGGDGLLRLWDGFSGAPLREFSREHIGWVGSVAFSPNGRLIVSGGGQDLTLRLWDASTGEPLGGPIRGHEREVNCLAISHDNRRIVSGGHDRTLRLWDADTGAPLGNPIRGHLGAVLSVAFSPDDRQIVSGSKDCTLRVRDTGAEARLRELPSGLGSPVKAIAFSPDGSRIFSGGSDGTQRLWNAYTGALLGEFFCEQKGIVLSVAFSPDGTRVVIGDSEYTLRLWDVATGAQLYEPLSQLENLVHTVAFSPDGSRIVSGSDDQTLRIWDAANGAPLGEPLHGHVGRVTSVAFSPDGSRIVSGDSDGTLRMWDAANGAPLGEPLHGHEKQVNSVAFSPDGSRIVSGSDDQTLRMWDFANCAQLREFSNEYPSEVRSVAFSRDSRRILSSSDDRSLYLWDTDTCEQLAVLNFDTPIAAVAVSATHIALGDTLGNVHILSWRIEQ